MTRRLFVPILAGARAGDRARACVGVLVALPLVGALGALAHGSGLMSPWITGPIGASALLVFAVPTSPMAQPWPVIGGNALAAAVGLGVGELLGHGTVAVGLAVALAIGLMSVTRSLHPPGGAAALSAALGGSALGWWFPLAPVALNAAVLVVAGVAYHRLSGHTYPHRAVPSTAAVALPTVRDEDIDAIVAEIGESFDVSPDDLRELVRRLEARLQARVG